MSRVLGETRRDNLIYALLVAPLVRDGAGAAHTPAASKKALVRLLNWFKTRIEAHPDTDYKFSLATRKRRADAGMPKAKKAKK